MQPMPEAAVSPMDTFHKTVLKSFWVLNASTKN
jgi:hypothetical protein